jgi:enoyl-CoA hydratase/carnithine racemase
MLATLARDLELETLTVEQDDRVLTVRFCDPPHNFMTARMQKDLDILTAAVDADTGVGAVVLTGGVPKRYITHFDIAEILAAARRVGRPLSNQAPPDDLIDEAKELGARYARRNRDTIAAQKKVFNENLVLNPAESLHRESAANVSTVLSGPAPQALQKWLGMQRNGESVFLTDLQPWIQGELVQLNIEEVHP